MNYHDNKGLSSLNVEISLFVTVLLSSCILCVTDAHFTEPEQYNNNVSLLSSELQRNIFLSTFHLR